MKRKLLRRLFLWGIGLPILLVAIVLVVVYFKQDAIVQSQIASLNETYDGKISVGDVHLAPFESFPYVSLKIDDVKVLESKDSTSTVLLDVADIYVGFSLLEVATGNFDIHSLIVEEGDANLIVHPDGSTNIQHALASRDSAEDTAETSDSGPFKIHLNEIELKNIDVHQYQEATHKEVETMVYWAKGGLTTSEKHIKAHVDSEFELNVLDHGDTTYLKHKHFEFHTDIDFNLESGMLVFKPSGITMEHGDFELEGSLDTKNENNIDLTVKGTKPSFDMFIAFAPEELIPTLERYDNAGEIYFNALIQGPTKGRLPFIDVHFGAKRAYLENSQVKKRIDRMGFEGHFTNGENKDLSTMEFSLTEIEANLEKGTFIGDIMVRNFEAPEIDMKLDADFELPFIVDFLGLEDAQDVKGSVEMHLRFHDIIDIENPEKTLQDLNQAYYAELDVDHFALNSTELPAELKDLNVHLAMNGKEAQLDQFEIQLGNSNLDITGSLSDLPAIVHHAPVPVNAHLTIASEMLDLVELTGWTETDSSGVHERISNLNLDFSFDALGNAFTEFKHLPVGEFFIENLYADLEHYPHTLHDFHADVLIKEDDLNVVDFTGEIDESDFHFTGLIHDYNAWMEDELHGDVDLDISLRSDLLKFDDLLSYRGENHMPPEYRGEELEALELHMESTLHYDRNQFVGIEVELDKLTGLTHVHPLKLENFNGYFEFKDEHLVVKDFEGKMGKTHFDIDMNYYTGDNDSLKLRDNMFRLNSPFIDFDALTNFETKEAEREAHPEETVDHEEAFNIYELPFTDMQFNVDVDHFIYHRLDLQDIETQFRITHDHYIYLDTVSLDAAGGHIAMNGYFNGSDPEKIYLKPRVELTNVDLDKLLFKFENFGQDAIVSENLHGQLNADITGNIRMFPDFVTDLDRSEVHLDVQVLNGRLENYDPILMLADYFGDKDLTSIKFDTLQNHMDFNYGQLDIPNMTIESSLGHMDISGSQNLNDSMNYYARIPWSLVKTAARNKLFGAKSDQKEDDIVEVDSTKRTRYLNVNIVGTFEDYDIRLRKDKRKP
ncbi:MAG: AsmA-like C-terminal region-containing protein [Flavobacteriales bacterium]|nr:AsmA-like C-terminal region-containing protein [Flavobacteriales bacterium]